MASSAYCSSAAGSDCEAEDFRLTDLAEPLAQLQHPVVALTHPAHASRSDTSRSLRSSPLDAWIALARGLLLISHAHGGHAVGLCADSPHRGAGRSPRSAPRAILFGIVGTAGIGLLRWTWTFVSGFGKIIVLQCCARAILDVEGGENAGSELVRLRSPARATVRRIGDAGRGLAGAVSPAWPGQSLWVANNQSINLEQFKHSQLKETGLPRPNLIGLSSAPLGISFDRKGNLWTTTGGTQVQEITAKQLAKLEKKSTPTPAVTITSSSFNLWWGAISTRREICGSRTHPGDLSTQRSATEGGQRRPSRPRSRSLRVVISIRRSSSPSIKRATCGFPTRPRARCLNSLRTS